MKRTAPKRKRSKSGLAPEHRVRAHRAKVERERERAEQKAFKEAVCSGPCVMCLEYPVPLFILRTRADDLRRLQAHHVLKQQHLRHHGLEAFLWRPENGACLCAYHHPRHEMWQERMPRRLLTDHNWAFAEEVGLTWLLEREHPE